MTKDIIFSININDVFITLGDLDSPIQIAATLEPDSSKCIHNLHAYMYGVSLGKEISAKIEANIQHLAAELLEIYYADPCEAYDHR